MNVYEQIMKHEGLRLTPYKCPAGKLTIGYGRNLEDRGITEEEAETLLLNDVAAVARELLYHKGELLQELSPPRRAVLVNMAFNLGVPRLLRFEKMWEALEQREYELAAYEMLNSRWAEQVGDRATDLAGQMRDNRWVEV